MLTPLRHVHIQQLTPTPVGFFGMSHCALLVCALVSSAIPILFTARSGLRDYTTSWGRVLMVCMNSARLSVENPMVRIALCAYFKACHCFDISFTWTVKLCVLRAGDCFLQFLPRPTNRRHSPRRTKRPTRKLGTVDKVPLAGAAVCWDLCLVRGRISGKLTVQWGSCPHVSKPADHEHISTQTKSEISSWRHR